MSNVTDFDCNPLDNDPIRDGSGYLFGLAAITAGMLTRSLCRLIPTSFFCPPYTVMMFVVGMLFERWSDALPVALSTSMDDWKHTHPHFILFVLVPPLLFESSFNVEWGAFRTQITSSMVLAGPGVLFCTGATAFCIYPVITAFNGAFTYEFAFLLAAIVTATDPVAVVGVLRDLGAPARLSMLVEGESLLNDGSAVMLFLVFKELVEDPDKDHTDLTAMGIAQEFAGVSGGALIWGLGVGYVTYLWMRAFDDTTVDITSLIIGVFITFYVAEHVMHVSGILALVVYGLFLARNKGFAMDHHEIEENAGVWEEAAFLSNTFIFVLAGLIISDRVSNNTSFDETASEAGVYDYMFTSVLLYVITSFVRITMLAAGFPLLHYLGYGLTMKEATMMSFSGLRGAISLALALLIEQSTLVGRSLCSTGTEDCAEAREMRDIILIQTAGVVSLSLLINGSLAGVLYKALHVYAVNPSMEVIQNLAMQKLAIEYEEDIVKPIKTHWLHRQADFKVVRKLIPTVSEIMFKEEKRDEGTVQWNFEPIQDAWNEHMEEYSTMSEQEIDRQLQESPKPPTTEEDDDDAAAERSDDRVEVIHMHAVDERVTPTALRGFHFDFEMEDADHDGVEDHPEHSLAAIYTVMINAVSASFDTERNQHLISRVCLANLHNCLDVSLDMLTKGIKVTDHPLIEFMEEVKRWIHNGQQGIAMSHHLFDHLLMSTEMLYGVITTFRDLDQVAKKIKLPGWMEHHDRFAHDIQKIVDTAVAQLKDLYHEHSRLMITIHTTLATRHIFHGLTHLIHEYADAGLLSPRFREDTDRQLEKQLDNIETFFDANPLKRLQFSVQERWNIIVRNNKASDMHPMVDRQIFKDERKRPTEHLVALNHSVCRAILTFLNPFTRTKVVYFERMADLSMTDGDGDGKESSGETAMPSSDGTNGTKMVNPLAGTDDGDDESEDE